MTRFDALERELTVWFDETAMPRRPDYTTEIIQSTAALPQRRWMTIERWFPMNVVEFRRRTVPPFPWRTAAVLVALIVLLVAGLVYVGSQPRLPPPFGLAGNGLVAYAKDGDIFTVDPATGVRRWVTSGVEVDATPRWSPDGTRIAFLRDAPSDPEDVAAKSSQRVVIVDRDRNVLAQSIPIHDIDVDAVAWSPDSRFVAAGSGAGLFVVDAKDGGSVPLDFNYGGLDVYWRPGHPNELLAHGALGLYVVDIEREGAARLVASEEVVTPDQGTYLRPNGWTPDGRRIVYTVLTERGDASEARVRIFDLETGAVVDIDAQHGDVSNDGRRLVAMGNDGRACIADIDGGPCVAIGGSSHAFDGTYAAGTFWAPNDKSILATSGDVVELLDPAGTGQPSMPDWIMDGAESWQRVAT